MKRFLIAGVMSLLLCGPVFAANVKCKSITPKTSTGTLISDLAVANGSTTYTEKILVEDNVGYSSVLITEDKSGGAGSITLTVEYSLDGTAFYTVYTTSSGSLTADSAVITTLANQTRWVQYTARLAKFLRYKIVAGAASEVTLTHIYQEDR